MRSRSGAGVTPVTWTFVPRPMKATRSPVTRVTVEEPGPEAAPVENSGAAPGRAGAVSALAGMDVRDRQPLVNRAAAVAAVISRDLREVLST